MKRVFDLAKTRYRALENGRASPVPDVRGKKHLTDVRAPIETGAE